MKKAVNVSTLLCGILCIVFMAQTPSAKTGKVQGWLNWRGPHQNGTSDETGLPDKWEPNGANHLWSYDLKGRGSPVIADEHVYVFGYDGTGADLQEYLVCLDSNTGKEIWKHGFNDFISDIVYDRYSIGSPTVDAETGNVYLMTTPGLFSCFTADGDLLWQISVMERFGRMTFPNGRTGAPVIDEDLVIINVINSFWGAEGPARNRFLAFDKTTGDLVWSSTPGIGPKDSSFSTPVFDWVGSTRVFYCGTGCGNIVCVNARTGEPIWRFQLSFGGVNSSVLLHKDKVIAIHGKENVDTTGVGRMAAIKTGAFPKKGEKGPVVLDYSSEVWRQDLIMFTSSPVLVGDRIYQTVLTGELVCLDANTGKILWTEKLATDQLHASPLYADGKLYVPMKDGTFYIIRPTDDGAEILHKVKLDANCLGSPVVWNGQMYLHTLNRLYCFGKKSSSQPKPQKDSRLVVTADRIPTKLQVVPYDVLIAPGESKQFQVRSLDQFGNVHPASKYEPVSNLKFEKFIPPTAKVKAKLDADFNSKGELAAQKNAVYSAGAFKATDKDGLNGFVKGRLVSRYPIIEDFESFDLTVDHPQEQGIKFAYPPLPWIGARFKWEIRQVDGSNVLAKTLDRVLFQRATTYIGHPNSSNYTAQVDIMTDGNRRTKSSAGVINQRYLIALIGNKQQLEISSNYNRIQEAVPFRWKENVWYTLKSRVDVAEDGSGIIRGKAWKRGDAEPDAWTIEVHHKKAHKEGVPGIYGFSPQSRFRVYVDNISITANRP